ncbi:MAG: hypothetical protein BAJALOKI3v1_530015 [Promethearchaeota archaeon]|nr:MAG: hypothetical protein BAJALOKI3v1_530015 [Candidatus Lokiarchaeota archaeon]
MAQLNDLTIPYIKKLASELEIDLKRGRKADLISQIKNSGISATKLDSLIEKYLKEKNKAKIKKKRKLLDIPELEQRIEKLEGQVEFLMSVIKTKNQLSHKKPNLIKQTIKREHAPPINRDLPEVELNTQSDIRLFLKMLLNPGDTITIDEIVRIDALQNISLNLLTQAINDLINNGIFEPIEGESIQKIQGNIGKLMRIR